MAHEFFCQIVQVSRLLGQESPNGLWRRSLVCLHFTENHPFQTEMSWLSSELKSVRVRNVEMQPIGYQFRQWKWCTAYSHEPSRRVLWCVLRRHQRTFRRSSNQCSKGRRHLLHQQWHVIALSYQYRDCRKEALPCAFLLPLRCMRSGLLSF